MSSFAAVGAPRPGPRPWPEDTPGLLRLPTGRSVRGRALDGHRELGAGGVPRSGSDPQFGLYLAAIRRWPGQSPSWECRWLRWPDFGVPLDRTAAEHLLTAAWQRAATQRVEIGCHGGRGRTGTALACLVVLDGLSSPEGLTAAEAIDWVRRRYHPRAVETPWQRRWIERFAEQAVRRAE